MVNIYKSGNGVLFKLTDNPYSTRGQELSFPSNSLTLLIDNSDIVTIRSSADNEVMLAARIDEIMINDEAVTKENIQEKWILVATSSQGGGGGTGGAVNSVNGQTGDVVLTASSLNAYTKSQVDSLVETKVDKEAYEADKGTFALKSELPDMTKYVDKTSYEDDKQTFALKSEMPSTENFVDKEAYEADKATFALKTDIPSLDGYATEEWVESKGYLTEHQDISNLATKTELTDGLALKVDKSTYDSEKQSFATKSEITDMATQTWVKEQGYLTEHQDISNLATKQELTEGLEGKQDKGDYALKSELPDLELYATKSEVTEGLATKQDKGNYATKEELNGKQDTLVSGTNIKTINGQTILGEGNIEIQGGGGGIADAPSDGKKYVRQNANWVEETTVDTSNLATKEEISDMLTKTEASSTYQPIGNYATKEEVTEGLDAKQDKGNYITVETADGKYQPIGNYATKSELDNKVDTSTYTEDKSTFALKSELTDLATKEELELKANTSDLSNYLTTSNAETTYAKKSEIPSLDGYLQTSVADEKYATKTELSGKADASEIADMLTKTEASSTYQVKGEYATTSQLSTKQDVLESGNNIKTINGESILGSGDIVIEGGGDVTKQYVDEQLALKADKTSVPTVQTDTDGNETNYIYSDKSQRFKRVISNLYSTQLVNTVLITQEYWGQTQSTSSDRVIINPVTSSNAGVMLPSDKIKLDSINTEEILTKTEASTTYQPKGEYATTSQLATKQDTLISGESIKTVNGESILGSGNIEIQGGSSQVFWDLQTNSGNTEYLINFYNNVKVGDAVKYNSVYKNNLIISITKNEYYEFVNCVLSPRVDSDSNPNVNKEQIYIKVTSDGSITKGYFYSFGIQSYYNTIEHRESLGGVILDISEDLRNKINDSLTKTEATSTYKTIASEWFGTQSEYDLITEKDPNVTYYITEG